ncbi:MAG: Trp family transcriptional regulator [Verrucomicrobiota bacterium]|jgi:TrpR family trp operon transcriptional repressor|nr:Trp family transcriptional regulator [Verrucomicrobiota bacterium]MDI9383034.1 Trp family transcriptional regulator [Verrucomicrobiota bacterium]HCF95061.1 transcriptional regulator [Verrucomicrobiota bacterium]
MDWDIIDIFTNITDRKEMERLFSELFTRGEVKDITLRWELMKQLKEGHSQREIAQNLKISLCKITRGARILKDSDAVLTKLLAKMETPQE